VHPQRKTHFKRRQFNAAKSVTRQRFFEKLQNDHEFDVVIIGAGINGACLYDTLCREKYKVLLVDSGDFASGTSQSSGMMIWGGLLYLKNLDLRTVFELSSDRNRIVQQKAGWMVPTMMRYLPSTGAGRAKWWVQSGLWLYWMMGLGQRRRPRSEDQFSELALLKRGLVNGSLAYEEAFLEQSDARFVYRWIAPHRFSGQVAMNYCHLNGSFSAKDQRWHLDVTDGLSGQHYPIQAKMVVNCAGIWTDQVNAEFGIESPFRHAFSKGVYLGIPRAEQHNSSLFFELGEHDDVITFVPWGPISLWGPTETSMHDLSEGLAASRTDVDYLLEHYARRFRTPIRRQDIVSVRCGVRPLVVNRHYQSDRYPLELSRRQEVFQSPAEPWISCYGGKLTGCGRMAHRALVLIKRSVAASADICTADDVWEASLELTEFPGLAQPVPSAAWCAEHESCCNLEDYLRRRTNIAQWIPRGGFGKNDCNTQILKNIALDLAQGDSVLAAQMFEAYHKRVTDDFLTLLTDDHS